MPRSRSRLAWAAAGSSRCTPAAATAPWRRGLAAVEVPAIEGTGGLAGAQRAGRPARRGRQRDTARYRLDVRLDDKLEGLGLLSDDTIGRERRTLRARYQLVDLASGAIVLDATAGSDAGIDVVSSEYATIAAEQTALENLSRVIADADRHAGGTGAAATDHGACARSRLGDMKATQKDFAAVAPRAARDAGVFFFCGPDEAGAAAAAQRVAAMLADPGERIEISGGDLRRDPVLLADEARSTSLFAGARHIVVRANGDEAHDAVANHLAAIDAGEGSACPVLVVATSATDKSRSAKLLEKRGDALVAMFWPPDLNQVRELGADDG